MFDYVIAECLDEALHLLAENPWQILAGGTDFYPALSEKPVISNILDISGLDELRLITEDQDCWRLGALSTWTDIIESDLPPEFNGLKLAGREVGASQIQNVATIGGNLCNASPAADGVPPLLTLGATIELSSAAGRRIVAIDDFIRGNRSTTMKSTEIMTAIIVPKTSGEVRSHFLKLGSRRYLVISIVMVATVIQLSIDNVIQDAKIAVGSCSPVAKRLTELEVDLLGQKTSLDLDDFIQEKHISKLIPIDDIRASAEYRRSAAVELIRRVLRECLEGA